MPKDTHADEQTLTFQASPAATYVVDRFEDNHLVVLEDEQGVSLTIPRHWLPSELAEGNVVVEPQAFISEDDADFTTAYRGLDIYIDPDATRARRKRARDLRDGLPKAPEGDLSL